MERLYLVSSLAFGRDNARYWELIALLSVVSIILWFFVVATTLFRLAAKLLWQHRLRTESGKSLRITDNNDEV